MLGGTSPFFRLARSFLRMMGFARPMLLGEKRKDPLAAACFERVGPAGDRMGVPIPMYDAETTAFFSASSLTAMACSSLTVSSSSLLAVAIVLSPNVEHC